MCLILNKNPELLIAKEDIRVFKYVSVIPESINKVLSYYYSKVYNKGEVCKDTLEIPKYNHTLDSYVIERAYHSFSLDIEHSITCGNIIIGNTNTPNCIMCPTHIDRGFPVCIALFVIPKGSKYYLQDNMYASDSIMFTGMCSNILTNGELSETLENFKKENYVSILK